MNGLIGDMPSSNVCLDSGVCPQHGCSEFLKWLLYQTVAKPVILDIATYTVLAIYISQF